MAYDVISGLDISSLASVTQAQLVQMVNQIAPLSNVGFVLAFDGAAAGAAGVGFPDVTTNPRYVRYLWIDTQNRSAPVLKRYSGTYAGTPAAPTALSNRYVDWVNFANTGVVGPIIESIYYPYALDATKVVNHATKYIEYVQTGSFPKIIQGKLVCLVADLDYSIGDEIAIESFQGLYAGALYPAFAIHRFNVGSDYKIRATWAGVALNDIVVLRKDFIAAAAIDQTKWAVKLYMYS